MRTAAFLGGSDTILSLLSDQLYDLYMDYTNPTELWDVFMHNMQSQKVVTYSTPVSNSMTSTLTLQSRYLRRHMRCSYWLGKIASLGCPLSDRFVAAGIIAKFSASWRDFATTLKYKRDDIFIEDLIIAFVV